MDGQADLHGVLPHVAQAGVRCGDSTGKKSVAWHVLSWYLSWRIPHMGWGDISSWQPSPTPISDGTHKVERQGDLILSGEDGGEGGRLFCPKSVIWSFTGVYACVHPQITGSIGAIPHLAPSLGTSREGLVALMVGLTRVRYRPGLSVSLWLMIIIIGTLLQCSKEVKLNSEGLTFPRKQICQVICLPGDLRR